MERASSSYFSNRSQKGRKTTATVQSLSGVSSPSAQDKQSMCILVLAVFPPLSTITKSHGEQEWVITPHNAASVVVNIVSLHSLN